MGWTVRWSNPGGGDIFSTHPDRPWGPPSLLCNGCRVSFPRVNRPGRGVDHTPPLAPRLNKEYSYTSTPTLGRYGLLWGESLLGIECHCRITNNIFLHFYKWAARRFRHVRQLSLRETRKKNRMSCFQRIKWHLTIKHDVNGLLQLLQCTNKILLLWELLGARSVLGDRWGVSFPYL